MTSGSGDSDVCQLTYIYNLFAQAFDSVKEVRAVLCAISKAFELARHTGLLSNLESKGLVGAVWALECMDRTELVMQGRTGLG